MKAVTLALAIFMSFAPPVHAAGTNLSWDDCGSAGQGIQSFACDTNTGPNFILIGSFVAPGGSTAITGMEVVIDIGSTYSPLPDWWKFRNAGSCRQSALTTSADFTTFGSVSCADHWAGLAAGAITAYITPFSTLDCRARLLLVFAVPFSAAAPVDEGVEYYGFRLAISRAQTVGTSSCPHCLAPAILVLNEMKLTQPAGIGDYRVQSPANRNYVEWQGGYTQCGLVPARSSTWGSIKSLYR